MNFTGEFHHIRNVNSWLTRQPTLNPTNLGFRLNVFYLWVGFRLTHLNRLRNGPCSGWSTFCSSIYQPDMNPTEPARCTYTPWHPSKSTEPDLLLIGWVNLLTFRLVCPSLAFWTQLGSGSGTGSMSAKFGRAWVDLISLLNQLGAGLESFGQCYNHIRSGRTLNMIGSG